MDKETYDYVLMPSNEELWLTFKIFTFSAIATSIIFYLSLYLFWDAPFIAGTTTKKRIAIISCFPSYIHAVLASLFSTYALCFENSLYEDYVLGRSVVATTACAITAGYMAGDLIIMFMNWRYLWDWQFLLHHTTSSAAFVVSCVYGSYSFFAMIRLLAEYSTIFVNNRAVFYDLGMQTTSAYFYNGLLMVISFTAARILPFPWYVYTLYSVTGTTSYNHSGIVKYVAWSAVIFLDSLNIIWYRKMLKGAFKTWNSKKARDQLEQADIKETKQD
ncbi:TLC domain-containing protein 4-like [Watersipora subatra]|uniref:TLC domain-containing protein 4-like n=1 Tax=Watersipora subatra TaxID=2589382 RepID=UPI00355C93E2